VVLAILFAPFYRRLLAMSLVAWDLFAFGHDSHV